MHNGTSYFRRITQEYVIIIISIFQLSLARYKLINFLYIIFGIKNILFRTHLCISSYNLGALFHLLRQRMRKYFVAS